MRRPIIISLSVGAALLMVSLGLLMAQTPVATASSGSVTHTTFNDFGNSGAPCLAGSNPALTGTHISDVGGGAVVLAGALDDDFPGSSLNASLWETGTWGANPYTPTISTSLLTLPATTTTDINGGWVRSLASYTPALGSPIVLEATAAFGNANSQHIGFGTANTSSLINQHILFSTYGLGDGNLYARVDNSGGTTNFNLGAIPTGLHRYRIEWGQTTVTTDTVTFFIDGVSQTAIDVAHASDYRTYLSNDGPADLTVDGVDVAPAYVTSGTYTSCILDAGADNAWQSIGWEATSPASTTLTVTARTSFDALTWSNWATMAVSGTAPGPASRYAQYELQLATTDNLTTTLVNSVNLAFDTGARTFAKSDGGTTQAAIGSVVPYTLTVTVPQTATRNLVITDTLPAGLIYNGSHILNGISTTPTFTPSAPNDGSAPVTLTWDFGAGDAIFSASPATIAFSAIVANVSGNQTGIVLTDTATMTYQNGAGNPQTPLTASDDFTVTEPALTVSKTITPSLVVNGDVITTTIRVTNTGTSTAFEVALTDPMPNSRFTGFGTISTPGGFTFSAPSSGPTTTVTYSGGTIAPTVSVTFSFTATVGSGYTPGETFNNTATITGTSLPGVDANERSQSTNSSASLTFRNFVIFLPLIMKSGP